MALSISLFEFHGVYPEDIGNNQLRADCPFCGKEEHFYVNPETFQWDCKGGGCLRHGNHLSFLTQLHAFHFEQRTLEKYEELAEQRQLPSWVFEDAKFAWDNDNNRWLVPYWGPGDHLANLGAFRPDVGFRIFKTPGLDLQLFNAIPAPKEYSIVSICEGEWDALALYALQWQFQAHGEDKLPGKIRAVPGATVFKREWLNIFKGKHVNLYYDYGLAGEKGRRKACALLQDTASSISYLEWPDDVPFDECSGSGKPGKDIRDLWADEGTDTNAKLEFIEDNLIDHEIEESVEGTSSALIEHPEVDDIRDWEELKAILYRDLYMIEYTEQAFATCIAACVATQLPDAPIWLFLVGPPSCGKSLLIQAFGTGNIYAEGATKFTSTTLVSGHKGPGGKDVSLLPRLKGRTLFIKDFTAVITMDKGTQEELYGLLRDAYDGELKITYGNDTVRDYRDTTFSLVAGVTKVIYKDNRASLGERFLKLNYIGPNFDQREHSKAALRRSRNKAEQDKKLQRSVLGYVEHLINNFDIDNLPTISEEMEDRLIDLGLLIAQLRTTVESDKTTGLKYRPVPEMGSRLAVIFSKLATCLAIVYQKDEVDNYIYRLIRRIGLDSVDEFVKDLGTILYKNPEGLPVDELCIALRLPPTTVHGLLHRCIIIGLVIQEKIPNGKGAGKNKHKYRLSDNMTSLWDLSKTPTTVVSSKKKVATKAIRQVAMKETADA